MNGATRPQSPSEEPRPFAYDSEGRPLYTAPPASGGQGSEASPQFVHVSRPFDPAAVPISPEVKAKHDASVKAYPFLNLSPGEYVVAHASRHPIGLILPVGFSLFLMALVVAVVIDYPFIASAVGLEAAPVYGGVVAAAALLCGLLVLGAYLAAWVYYRNRLFLTNESLIQEIQNGLFDRREQTVSLSNVEDVSYAQKGLIQSIFNYGSLRLSTEGEESTYEFDYVAGPKEQAAVLNNAVEAFKNGRPISE